MQKRQIWKESKKKTHKTCGLKKKLYLRCLLAIEVHKQNFQREARISEDPQGKDCVFVKNLYFTYTYTIHTALSHKDRGQVMFLGLELEVVVSGTAVNVINEQGWNARHLIEYHNFVNYFHSNWNWKSNQVILNEGFSDKFSFFLQIFSCLVWCYFFLCTFAEFSGRAFGFFNIYRPKNYSYPLWLWRVVWEFEVWQFAVTMIWKEK